MNKVFILITGILWSSLTFAEDFAFNILAQDESIVTATQSEGNNVWIKLNPNHLSDTITVRISNRDKDFYRTWFNDSTDLVSTGYRGGGVWSDRVQTEAKFIEYWMGDTLVLHLERK